MKKPIKLFDPHVGKGEEKIVQKVLKSKFWASGAGIGYVKKFENSFKKYVGSKECIAVNSGTAALNLSLSLFDLKNREIILPSMTFASTAHAAVLNGGKPVFVDIDENTLCINTNEIKKNITKKTKAVVLVHFAGMPCNLDKIRAICKMNNLLLIEDAAHAAGSRYKNKRIGSHGDAVCFSFHPVKNLAMPSGGLITINHPSYKDIRRKLIARRWCGITNRQGSNYDIEEIGWNYYMNEFSAAIGLEQLKKLDKMNSKRRKIAYRYNKEINLYNKIPFAKDCSYHLYWIRIKKREKIMKILAEKGIETGVHYKPLHKMSFYKTNKKLPITDKVGKEILSIPIHPNLTNNDVDFIIKEINKIC